MEEDEQEMREVAPIAISRLLALPRELRNLVYKELIYTIHEDVVSREKPPLSARPRLRHLTGLTGHPATSSPIYAILNTCRPLRAEFTEELYRYAHEDCTVTSTSLGLTRDTHYGLTSTTFYNALDLAHGPMFQSPLWTINALPVPQSFSQHLRSFSFSFSEDEVCPLRGIHRLNSEMELAVTNILSALPQLEYLQVALLLPPGPWTTAGPGPGLNTARMTGFQVPGSEAEDKKSSKTPEPTRVGRRLKQFKKSIQVKFASLPNFPFTWVCQEDCFKDGKRKDFTRTNLSIRFV
ncbi:hypothetical protein SLS58_009616 [Diplodia intermedia]|uniref:Uncharacterized protein n=1 Tax=Diplodia intermedia TaxID=856260 RepID=A0ABR3TB95_9PEZI